MIYCCGGYYNPSQTVFLLPDSNYRDRKLEIVICPKCGAVMSPFERCCIKCTQNSFEITYATSEINSALKHSHSNGSTIYDFLGNRKDEVGYE